MVGQLNWGISLVSQQQERDELARLNLVASRKAQAATAYQAGYEYASQGLSLLGEHAWSRQYELALALHELATELAALCGDGEAMERLAGEVIAHTHSLLEQTNVYRIQIQAKNSQGEFADAIAIARKFWQQFHITFPDNPTPDDIQRSIAEVERLLANRDIESLIDLPWMEDPEKNAIAQITNSILSSVYRAHPSLFPLVTTLSTQLFIQYGNTAISPAAYASYSATLLDNREIDTGVRFYKLALKLLDKTETKTAKPETLMVVGLLLFHRNAHLHETLPLLREGYRSSLENGDLEKAGYHAQAFCCNAFWCGCYLSDLERKTRAYYHRLEQINQSTAANYIGIYWQSVGNKSKSAPQN